MSVACLIAEGRDVVNMGIFHCRNGFDSADLVAGQPQSSAKQGKKIAAGSRCHVLIFSYLNKLNRSVSRQEIW
jgi:hypothetical protein